MYELGKKSRKSSKTFLIASNQLLIDESSSEIEKWGHKTELNLKTWAHTCQVCRFWHTYYWVCKDLPDIQSFANEVDKFRGISIQHNFEFLCSSYLRLLRILLSFFFASLRFCRQLLISKYTPTVKKNWEN